MVTEYSRRHPTVCNTIVVGVFAEINLHFLDATGERLAVALAHTLAAQHALKTETPMLRMTAPIAGAIIKSNSENPFCLFIDLPCMSFADPVSVLSSGRVRLAVTNS